MVDGRAPSPPNAPTTVPDTPPTSPGRLRRALQAVGAGVGLTAVFAVSAAAGVLLHVDTPPARRVVQRVTNVALGSVFQGTIEVGDVRSISLTGGVDVGSALVLDPEGVPVIRVDGLRVRMNLLSLARSALVGSGGVRVFIPFIHVDNADVLLEPSGEEGQLGIARAFASKPSKKPKKPKKPSVKAPQATVDLERIEIEHASVHGAIARPRVLDADVEQLRAALHVGPDGFSLDVEPTSLVERAMLPVKASGRAEYHLRRSAAPDAPPDGGPAPAPALKMWGDVEARLGEIDARSSVKLDGDHIEAEIDVPHLTPEALAKLAPTSPLRRSVAAKARLYGDLPALQIDASARIDGDGGGGGGGGGDKKRSEAATLEIQGDLRVDKPLRIEARAEASRVDPRAFGDDLPEALINARVDADIELGDRPRVVAFAHTDALEIQGQLVPSLEISAVVDGDQVSGTVDADEAGMPLEGSFRRIPGGVRFEASTRVGSIREIARLNAPIDGRADVAVSGELKDGELSASVRASIAGLRAPGDVEIGAARATGRVHGPLKDLTLSASLHGQGLKAGSYDVSTFSVAASGPVKAPLIRSTFRGDGGELIRVSGTIDAASRGARRVEVHVEKGGQTLDARAARISAKGGAVVLDGLSARGDAIEGLDGSLVVRDRDVTGKLHAESLDIGRLLALAGLPARARGLASLDVDIEKTKEGRRGHVSVALEEGEASILSGVSSMLSVRFDDRRATADGFVRVVTKAAEGDAAACCGGQIGALRVSGSSDDLRGPLLAPATWSKLSGSATIAAEDVDIGCVADLVPGIFAVLPVSEVAGQLSARLTLAREAGQRFASLRDVSLKTRGLRVIGEPRDGEEEPAWQSRSIDARFEGSFDAATGATRAGVALLDKDLIVELQASAELDAAALLDRPSDRKNILKKAPIAGTLTIPRRSLASFASLPFVKPGSIPATGDVSLNAYFAGTAEEPSVAARVMGWDVGPKPSEDPSATDDFTLPVDLDALLTYDSEKATMEAHVANDHRELLTAGAEVLARLDDVLAGKLKDPRQRAWKASVHAELNDAPLGDLPFFARHEVSGHASGSIAIRGINDAPSIAVDLSVPDLAVGKGLEFETARLSLHVDPTKAGAPPSLGFSSPNLGVAKVDLAIRHGGRLTFVGYSGVQWKDGFLPSPDRDAPADLYLNARRFRIEALQPFVASALSRLDGYLDGDLRVGWRRVRDENDTKIEADMALNDGIIHIPRLGQELRDAHVRILSTPAGGVRFDDIGAKALTGRVQGWAFARLNGLSLDQAAAQITIAEEEALPIAFEGVPLGSVHGTIAMTATKNEDHLTVALRVPDIHVELPSSIGRRTQSLEENPDIHVLQPLGPPKREAREEASTNVTLTVEVDQAKIDSSIVKLALATRKGAPIRVEMTDKRRIGGDIELLQGELTFMGKRFELERGLIHMSGQADPNPFVNATIRWDAPDGSHIFIDYVGTLSPITDEKIQFRSDPPRTKQEIIATLLLGSEYEHGTVLGGSAAKQQEEGPTRSTTTAASGIAAGFIAGQLGRLFANERWKTSIETTDAGAFKTGLAYEGGGARAQITYEGAGSSSSSTGTRTPAVGNTEVSIDWRFQKNWLVRGMVRMGEDQPSSGVDLLWQYRY